MQEQSPLLEAAPRERLGSRYAQRLRSQVRLPAIVYGHKIEPKPISLDAKSTLAHIHSGEKVFRLELDKAAPEVVLLKELQFDHLGTNIIHADFARVDLEERVHTRVHIKFVGEAVGLKEAGAVLIHPLNELEIECRVADMPDEIEVDITNLGAGDSISAEDVKLPAADMKVVTDPSALVCQVSIQAEAPELAEEETVEGEAEPEVISEKKEEDEDENSD
jgi:large subunit ribosomal protein L25